MDGCSEVKVESVWFETTHGDRRGHRCPGGCRQAFRGDPVDNQGRTSLEGALNLPLIGFGGSV